MQLIEMIKIALRNTKVVSLKLWYQSKSFYEALAKNYSLCESGPLKEISPRAEINFWAPSKKKYFVLRKEKFSKNKKVFVRK